MEQPPDRFNHRCVNANRALQSCVGYFIERISLNEDNTDNTENTLDIRLRGGEGLTKPKVVISLASLYSVRPIGPDVGGVDFPRGAGHVLGWSGCRPGQPCRRHTGKSNSVFVSCPASDVTRKHTPSGSDVRIKPNSPANTQVHGMAERRTGSVHA